MTKMMRIILALLVPSSAKTLIGILNMTLITDQMIE